MYIIEVIIPVVNTENTVNLQVGSEFWHFCHTFRKIRVTPPEKLSALSLISVLISVVVYNFVYEALYSRATTVS